MKILVIEDDVQTGAYISKGLQEEGHVVDLAPNGRDGLFLAAGEAYDIMIVDRMLPALDGLSLVKTIRAAGVKTPVKGTGAGYTSTAAGFAVGTTVIPLITGAGTILAGDTVTFAGESFET